MDLFSRAFSAVRDFIAHPIQTVRGERQAGPSAASPQYQEYEPPSNRDRAVNTRGFSIDEMRFDYGKWRDINVTVHADSPRTSDLPRADVITVKITYPDGHYVWRTFAGPFGDWEDVMDAIEEWFYDTEY